MEIFVGGFNIFTEIWATQFFPEDLPNDWRIDYYSNEFDLVHIPVEAWQTPDFAPMDEDWPESLKGIVEIDDNLLKSSRWGQIEAWIKQSKHIIATTTSDTDYSGIHFKLKEQRTGIKLASSQDLNVLLIDTTILDLKEVKQEVEKLTANDCDIYIIADTQPSELEQVKTLIELMGY